MINNEKYNTKSVILVVDDDNRIRKLLGKFLRENNFIVLVAKDAIEARALIKEVKFDLIVLDVMMPKETGNEFTKSIRKESEIPILMLSAMGTADQRINGLESGADDYITKPFEPRELLLRIKKILERFKLLDAQQDQNIVRIGNMSFDISTNKLSNMKEAIFLTSGESKLLSILVKNIGLTMTRDHLCLLSGGVNERSIDVQIIRLRNKIEVDAKKPRYLHTIRGKGYVLYSD